MASVICYHEGKYNVYSTISDSFCHERGMTLEQLRQRVRELDGQNGVDELAVRLDRAHRHGHSSAYAGTLEEFLYGNRAGESEAELAGVSRPI